jgi:predicted ATPase/serine/threonine protein kinase
MAELAQTKAQLQMEKMFLRVQHKLFGDAPVETMAHYSVVRPIGQGAMGVVYEAIDTRLGREVALKLLLPQLMPAASSKPRLFREARALAKISHPNVVAVYDVGEINGVVFIAMELIRGITLRQWLRGEHSLPEILDVFSQAGAGLTAAHQAGIIHRDFKPDNVLIGADGRARVVDFGLAFPRFEPRAEARIVPRIEAPAGEAGEAGEPARGTEWTGTDANMLVGTLAYMSPEQLRAQPLDGRSDQFGFCVSLYEALYGQRPFGGGSFHELVERVWRGELAPVASPPRLPGWLTAIVRRGLSIPRDARFASMAELVSLLSAGRELLTSQRVQPAWSQTRDRLLGRLCRGDGSAGDQPACTLEDPVATWPTGAMLRVQRTGEVGQRLVVAPHDPHAPRLRAAFAAYAERCRATEVPALLRPLELIADEDCLALVFEDLPCVTLGALIRQRAGRDLGLALQIAISLTDAVYALAQLGYALDPAALEYVPVGAPEYAIGPIDPVHLAEGGADASGRYRVVGAALLALLASDVPDLGELPARLPTSSGEDDPLLPPPVRALIERLLDPAGYRSARGVLHDLAICLAEHRRGGPIAPFPLATRDVSGRFQVSGVMRGRRRALARFEGMARQVGPAGSGLALVLGPSGIGKTRLLDEISARLERGWRIRGKFDQYARTEPYATLAQALRGLIRQILEEPRAARDEWRDLIVRAVAPNAELLFSLIPEIRALIGDQPAVAAMPPVESAARFGETLKRLLVACAAEVELLVVVLDDMQWCDLASIRLICSLLGDREVRHILWICAFRDNELTPAHPLHELLAAVPARPELRVELPVQPLSRGELEAFLADSLGCTGARAAALAAFFDSRTDGNPLDARTLLASLFDQGFFTFSPRRERWDWDDAAIRSAELPGDLLELIAHKIESLPPPARELLSAASCVGRDIEAELLLDVVSRSGQPRAALAAGLQECVARGLLASAPGGAEGELLNFTHDRVQQTAHRFLEPARRERVLLETGRALLERSSPDQLAERLFRIVGFLNGGAAQATGELRDRIAELDLAAARRALAANAFADSARFLEAALALLPEDRWTARYDQTIELYVTYMHALALLGDRDEEERLFELLRQHVHTAIHLGRIYELEVMLQSSRGEHRAAIERGIAGLRALGERIPAAPGRLTAMAELVHTWWVLRRLDPDDIQVRPSSDGEDEPTSRLLVALSAPAFLADPNLLFIVMMRIVRRAVSFGVSDVSSHGFAGFGLILSGALGRYEQARRYAMVAHHLDERFGNPWLQPKVDLMSGIFIQPWTRPFERCEEILARGERVATDNADFVYASYNATSRVCLMYYRGAELGAVLADAAVALRETRRARDHDMEAVVATVMQASRCLRGETGGTCDFSSPEQSDRDFMASLDERSTPIGVFFCRVLRCGVLYFHGRADLVCELGRDASVFEANAFSNPSFAEYLFYYAMALLARWPELTRRERRRARRVVRRARAKFRVWARSCPENFAARRALLEAERARVRGRGQVLEQLNAALEAAVRDDRPQYEGLAAELAARQCDALGQATVARIYRERALRAYRRWGATVKARELADQLEAPAAVAAE